MVTAETSRTLRAVEDKICKGVKVIVLPNAVEEVAASVVAMVDLKEEDLVEPPVGLEVAETECRHPAHAQSGGEREYSLSHPKLPCSCASAQDDAYVGKDVRVQWATD